MKNLKILLALFFLMFVGFGAKAQQQTKQKSNVTVIDKTDKNYRTIKGTRSPTTVRAKNSNRNSATVNQENFKATSSVRDVEQLKLAIADKVSYLQAKNCCEEEIKQLEAKLCELESDNKQ